MHFLSQLSPGDNKPSPEHLYNNDFSIAFSLWGMDIAWYGVFMFFAFLVAIVFIVIKIWKFYKIPMDPFYWFIFMAIPTAILGARIWSCVIGDAQWEHFFNFNQGGLAVEGGVMFPALLALWWFPFILKKPKYQVRALGADNPEIKQVSTWIYADAILPAILIGQVIGRWGNYFNQEIYGNPVTDENMQIFLKNFFPWMYVVSPGDTLDAGWRQPLFLYEMLINFFGFILIFFALEFVNTKKAGDLGISYFLWYGIVRLCMEPLRVSTFTFSTTYWMSGIWVAIGIILLILNHTLFGKTRSYKVKNIIFTYIPYKLRITFSNWGLILDSKKNYRNFIKNENFNYKAETSNLSEAKKAELSKKHKQIILKANLKFENYIKNSKQSEVSISTKKAELKLKIKEILAKKNDCVKTEINLFKEKSREEDSQYKKNKLLIIENKNANILKTKNDFNNNSSFKKSLCKNIKINYLNDLSNITEKKNKDISAFKNTKIDKIGIHVASFENERNNLIKEYDEFKNKEKLKGYSVLLKWETTNNNLNKATMEHSKVLYNKYEQAIKDFTKVSNNYRRSSSEMLYYMGR